MLAPFIVCLREGIEIFLVTIPLILYFNKNKMYSMAKSVYQGGAIGAILAFIVTVILFQQVFYLEGVNEELFDGILGIILSVLVLYSVVLLRKNKIFNLKPDEKFLALSRKGVFLIATITFFRELLEATLFILRSAAQSPIILVGSSLFGLICAALIVYFVTAGISNLNIELVFYILNLFLIGIGAYYFGDGLDVLFSNSIPEIFKIGVLCYAVPSYVIIIKKDLKKFINSDKIK